MDIELEIFPHRVLGADTTEKLLNDIEDLETVKRTVIQGPKLSPQDPNENPKYDDRRKITVNGKEIDLKVKTGRIFIEISDESARNDIEEICEIYLPFGFDINSGKFIRTQKTVSDNLKYGDADIPDELVGMTDQSAKLSDRLTFIKKNKKD